MSAVRWLLRPSQGRCFKQMRRTFFLPSCSLRPDICFLSHVEATIIHSKRESSESSRRWRTTYRAVSHHTRGTHYSVQDKDDNFTGTAAKESSREDLEVLQKRNGEDAENSDGYDYHDDDPDLPKPFQNLLYLPARCLARGGFAPPPALTEAQANIIKIGNRSTKLLKTSFDKQIQQHNKLREFREEVRQRENRDGRKSIPKKGSIEAENFARKERETRPIHYGPQESLVQSKYRLLPNYSVVRRVLRETRGLIGTLRSPFRPRRILDMGIGCGSASAAALQVFGPPNIDWIHGVDISKSQREVSVRLLEQLIEQHHQSKLQDDEDDAAHDASNMRNTRITVGDSLGPQSQSSSAGKEGATAVHGETASPGTFDLALCCYTLHEVKHSAASLSMAAVMWEKLADGGVLVVIEPGTPDGFHTVRSIRTMLLQCCPPSETKEKHHNSSVLCSSFAQEECHVIAPCTHNGACPMERFASSSILHSWHDVVKEDKEEIDWLGEDFDAENHPDWVEDGMSSSSGKQLTVLDQLTEGEAVKTDNLPDEEVNINDNEDFTNMPKYMSNVTQTVQQKAFCSFVQGMHGADRKTEKFSYLVVQKRVLNSSNFPKEQERNDSPFTNVSLPDMIAQSINEQGKNESLLDRVIELEDEYMDSEADDCGLELAQGSNLSSWGRIIRAPLKKKGHVYIDFCTSAGSIGKISDRTEHKEDIFCDDNESAGRILRHRITKAASIKAPGIYHAARKARWGGLWPDLSERLHLDEVNGKT